MVKSASGGSHFGSGFVYFPGRLMARTGPGKSCLPSSAILLQQARLHTRQWFISVHSSHYCGPCQGCTATPSRLYTSMV